VSRPNLTKLLPLQENERRQWPRYLVPDEETVVVGVALLGAGERRLSLTGRVRDISEAGLSLLLPTGEECGELSEHGRSLAVFLTLPSGTIRLRAEIAHCDARRGRGGALLGYQVGVRIREIAAEDHDRLIEYIDERS
jgi:hypothetical protein